MLQVVVPHIPRQGLSWEIWQDSRARESSATAMDIYQQCPMCSYGRSNMALPETKRNTQQFLSRPWDVKSVSWWIQLTSHDSLSRHVCSITGFLASRLKRSVHIFQKRGSFQVSSSLSNKAGTLDVGEDAMPPTCIFLSWSASPWTCCRLESDAHNSRAHFLNEPARRILDVKDYSSTWVGQQRQGGCHTNDQSHDVLHPRSSVLIMGSQRMSVPLFVSIRYNSRGDTVGLPFRTEKDGCLCLRTMSSTTVILCPND